MASLYDLSGSILADWGETATLVADGWRSPSLTVAVVDRWNGALAGGIDVERIEPLAYVATADVDDYEFSNGWMLEVGTDTYRITSQAVGQDGLTVLTLAKT